MHITFVKKILANGELCQKCRDVSDRLEADGLLPLINEISIADERDANSEGMKLAKKHQVERAPFFLAKDKTGEITVYDVYFKLKKTLNEKGLLNTSKLKL